MSKQPDIELALESAKVAKEIIDGWAKDQRGLVHIHPDVISKAVNAVIANLQGNENP